MPDSKQKLRGAEGMGGTEGFIHAHTLAVKVAKNFSLIRQNVYFIQV
jgi:hypothetical protein